ncbi:hypothetical protein GCM10027167_82610 [Nocardia heshunensis]
MPNVEWHKMEDKPAEHLQNVPLGDEISSGAGDYDFGIAGEGVGSAAVGQCPGIRNAAYKPVRTGPASAG